MVSAGACQPSGTVEGTKYMKNHEKSKSAQLEVTMDIKGVKPETRIGKLTVHQFVQLMFQLTPQLPMRLAIPNRRYGQRARRNT